MFKLDAFTGELRTVEEEADGRSSRARMLRRVNMISMEVDILILKVNESSQRLMRKYTISVFVNITSNNNNNNNKDSMTNAFKLLYSVVDRLHGDVLKHRVTSVVDTTTPIRILNLNSTNNQSGLLTYSLDSVREIDLDSPVECKNYRQQRNDHNFGFEIINDESSLVLDMTTALDNHEPLDYRPQRLVYLIRLRACLQQTTVENTHVFSRECRVAEFNVDVAIEIGVDDVKFESDKLYVRYVGANNVYFDSTSLDVVDSTRPLIDLKKFLKASRLLDIKPKEAIFRLEQEQEQQLQLQLDELNGLVYIPNLSMTPTRDYSVDVYVRKSSDAGVSSLLTRSKLVIQLRQLETSQNVSVTVLSSSSPSRLVEWINVFKLDLIDWTDPSIFKSLAIAIKCVSLHNSMCESLFRFEKLTGWLQINSQAAQLLHDDPSPVDVYCRASRLVQLRVEINRNNRQQQEDERLFDLDLNVRVRYGEFEWWQQQQEPVEDDSPRVYLINSTETSQRFDLIEKRKLLPSKTFANGSFGVVEVVRVKNMLTNNQVLALGYRIVLDNHDQVYQLQLDDVQSLELNQLYAFDLVVRRGQNYNRQQQLSSFLPTSIYFLRFNPYYASDLDKVTVVKFYASLNGRQSAAFNLTKIQIEYGEDEFLNDHAQLDSPEFVQSIVIIDRVWSNRPASCCCSDVDDRRLRRYFKVADADMIYFDSSSSLLLSSSTTQQHNDANRLLGDTIEVDLFKFLVDKISLKVIRIIKYQVIIIFIFS